MRFLFEIPFRRSWLTRCRISAFAARKNENFTDLTTDDRGCGYPCLWQSLSSRRQKAPPSWTSLINSSCYIPQRDASHRDDANEVPLARNSHVRFCALPVVVDSASPPRSRNTIFRAFHEREKPKEKSGRTSYGRSRTVTKQQVRIPRIKCVSACAWQTRGVATAHRGRDGSPSFRVDAAPF